MAAGAVVAAAWAVSMQGQPAGAIAVAAAGSMPKKKKGENDKPRIIQRAKQELYVFPKRGPHARRRVRIEWRGRGRRVERKRRNDTAG